MVDDIRLTITVLYSCRACGLVDRPVRVKARETEDVVVWFEKVMGPALANDHRERSPGCSSMTASDVKVPIGGADRVGGASVN